MSESPWTVPALGNDFFLATGLHGTHVLIGVVVLLATYARTHSGNATPEGVERAGLYRHFVDLVWVFIFTLVYLLERSRAVMSHGYRSI